jgi:P pilus assembly chaperone PapD
MVEFDMTAKRAANPLHSRFIVVLVATALGLGVRPGHAAAAVSLSVSPIRIELNVPAGSIKTDVLTIENRSDEPLKLHVTIADWHLTPDGTPVFVKRGKEPAFSMSAWIEVNPTELQVPPQGKTTLRYTIAAPPDTPSGGYRTAILIESLPEITSPSQPSMAYLNARIGVILYDRIGAATPSIEIVAQDLVPDPEKPDHLALRLTVRNTGRVHARVSGTSYVVSDGERERELGSVTDSVVLPESERYLFVPLIQPLPATEFRLVSRLDIGVPELLEAETPIVPKSRN